MAEFPAANTFDVPAILTDFTPAEAATALNALRDAALQFPGGEAVSELTIASGVIIPTSGVHTVDTEGNAATDDLTHVQLDNIRDGGLIVLLPESIDRVVTVKHGQGGNGQLMLAGDDDLALEQVCSAIWLQRRGSYWREITRGFCSSSQAEIVARLDNLEFFVFAMVGYADGVFAYGQVDTPGVLSLKCVATSPESMYVTVGAGAGFLSGVGFRRESGGNSALLVAPVSNPRIDTVAVDSANSGAIVIYTGVEAATPVAPAVGTGKLKVAEIYHRVGETAIYDADTSGEGYITDARTGTNF
jgi:hypothetical protein